MEESLFRQLLSRSTHSVLDQPTLAKGADYLRRSRVRDIWYESADDSGTLYGSVQGSEPNPYTSAILIGINGGKPKFHTQCTCPLEGECKHVAAVALKMLGAQSSAIASGKPDGSAASGPAAWKPWFDAINAEPRSKLRRPAEDQSLVFGILLRMGDGTLPGLQAQPVWLKPNKRGGLGSPQPIGQFQFGADPWQRLSPHQFEHVARLRMASPHYASSAWYPLTGERDEALLEILIKEYPCFLEKPSRGQLVLGDQRTLDWGWQLFDDGNQKLVPQLVETDPTTRLLRIAQIWYYDPAKPAIGRVEGDPQVIDTALRAPALLPEHADFVVERWHQTQHLQSLPKPSRAATPQTHEVVPIPILTLRAFPVIALNQGVTHRYQAGCVRLSFDYEGPRLPFASAKPRERRMHDGRLLDIVRDRSAEIAAVELLEELGLIDIDLLPRLPNLPRDTFADGDFLLEPRRGQLIAAEHLFALAPRLRDAGFQLETDAGFPFELLDEPDDWYAEIEESGNAWFDLSLGIDIGGERVDLLPILRRLLGDPGFPLSPRKGEDADALWLVPIDDRRRVPLPLARLRDLMSPLLEWLQDMPERDAEQGSLRLRRSQVSVLDELSAKNDMPWRGGEKLREQLTRLRDAREPAIEPPGFKATLRSYQRDGLAWLGFLADAGLGGVLADDMGLGKTVQVLAHLLAEKQRGHLDRPALIVAPTSLVSNWRDEARRFTPDLSVLVLHGPARAGLHEAIPHHDLVITTYPLLARDRDELLAHEYAVLVLDESQVVKNAKSQAAKIVREISAQRRLAMTGTPLENHLGELWAQFDAVEPGLLGSERHFTRFYRTPIEKHNDVERRERLSRRIAPLLLRRRKEDVLADLPEKTFIPRNIELEGAQRELYETLRLAQHERVLAEVQKRGLAQSGIIVLDALLKLRQACCDPRLVKLEGAKRIKESAKLELLLELTDSLVAEGRRILVFSQFAEMLALIAKALTLRKQKFQMLTGQTPSTQRADLVARFQAEEVPIFLISLKAGGVGLNLTAADTVIHYDPWWNPAVEAQATDRAHRIGQEKHVFVYKLICTGTVEEKIQAMQQRKADLAKAVLEGGSTQSLRFDEDDLAELFAPL